MAAVRSCHAGPEALSRARLQDEPRSRCYVAKVLPRQPIGAESDVSMAVQPAISRGAVFYHAASPTPRAMHDAQLERDGRQVIGRRSQDPAGPVGKCGSALRHGRSSQPTAKSALMPGTTRRPRARLGQNNLADLEKTICQSRVRDPTRHARRMRAPARELLVETGRIASGRRRVRWPSGSHSEAADARGANRAIVRPAFLSAWGAIRYRSLRPAALLTTSRGNDQTPRANRPDDAFRDNHSATAPLGVSGFCQTKSGPLRMTARDTTTGAESASVCRRRVSGAIDNVVRSTSKSVREGGRPCPVIKNACSMPSFAGRSRNAQTWPGTAMRWTRWRKRGDRWLRRKKGSLSLCGRSSSHYELPGTGRSLRAALKASRRVLCPLNPKTVRLSCAAADRAPTGWRSTDAFVRLVSP